jgi:4-amino-4-deoxy-L-arabinose transferase-like glycosyltransferase
MGRGVSEDGKVQRRRLLLILAAIFILSLAVRIPRYSDQPIMPDEVTFFQRYSYTILEQGWRWPVKYMYIHPPLFPYLLSFLTVIAGGSLGVLRLVPVLMGALTPVFVVLLGRDLYGEKAGLLAALLMAFSSTHILYSRVLMLEVPMILFFTAGMYLLVKSLREVEGKAYGIGAGVLFGLAIITKWVAVLYLPALLLFVVLRKRSLRGLLDRRILSVVAVSLKKAAPCVAVLSLQGVNPVYRNLGIGTPPVVRLVGFEDIGFPDLAVRGISNYLEMTMDSASEAAGMLPWADGLIWIGGVVFLITMVWAVRGWLRGKEAEALLFSTFLAFNLFVALYGKRFQYYLVWSLPTYLILVSGALTGISHFRIRGRFAPKAAGAAGLVLSYILVLSFLMTGILAPFANGGPTYGFDEQVRAMRPTLSPGDVVAATFPEVVYHYLEEYGFDPFENEILLVSLNKMYLSPIGFVEELDMRLVSRLNPRYVLTNRYYFDELAGTKEIRTLNEGYRLVSEVNEVMLFEISPG